MTYTKTENFNEWMEWVESTQEVDDDLREACNEVKNYFSAFVIGETPSGMRCRVRRGVGVGEVCEILSQSGEKSLTLNTLQREGDMYSLRFTAAA
jgi:hypothetical protein